jgi:glyoxylase-like metal-dependent hydrolase (beta-lactamase superfamily II)
VELPWGHADVVDLGTVGTEVDCLVDLATVEGGPGARLTEARRRAEIFRREFPTTGTPDSVLTCDLVTLPYPTRFGLFRASRALAPFLSITNRMLVIRWHDSDGTARVLLFEPSDVELGRNTPYFDALAKRTPGFVTNLMVSEHGSVLGHLARLGIAPADVDYLMFDHLHTQDLRRWVGTTTEQADLGARPVAAFPNAKVIVQRDELAAMGDLHPLQKPWYQASKYRDVPPGKFLPIDGGVVLGPGVAVVKTPGHVFGNQSLVLNTSTGIWVSSENVIAAECLTPQHSRLPGLAGWSRSWQQEIVLNANSIETTADQYNSVVFEKTLADASQRDPRFVQFFPSSELTAAWTNPGTRPTFTHTAISHTR